MAHECPLPSEAMNIVIRSQGSYYPKYSDHLHNIRTLSRVFMLAYPLRPTKHIQNEQVTSLGTLVTGCYKLVYSDEASIHYSSWRTALHWPGTWV